MKNIFGYLIVAVLVSACGGAEDRKAKYFEDAEQFFADKNYEKALLGYKNVLQIDPKDNEARFGYAKVLVAQQDWRNAAGQLRAVLEENPDYSEAGIELGKLFLLAREPELAEEEADKVLAREPNYVPAKILQAAVLAQRGKAEQAISAVEKVLRENQEDIDAITLYASLLLQSRQFELANDVLNQGLEIHENNLGLMNMLVQSHTLSGDVVQAERMLTEMIGAEPHEFVHKQRLAAFYIQQGDIDKAENVLRNAIEDTPENMEPKRALIDLLVQQKRSEDARSLLSQYAQDFPDEVDFRLAAGRLDLLDGNREEATRKFEGIAEDFEGKKGANAATIEIAKLAIVDQKYDDARALLDGVLEIDPSDVEALILRGRVFLTQRSFVDAINDFRSLLKSDPDNYAVMAMLAEAHYSEGQLELAESNYKRLVKRDPKDLRSRNALATIYTQKGNIEEALKLRQEIHAISANDLNNLTEMTKLQLQARNESGAQEAIEELLSLQEGQAPGYYYAGLLDQSTGKHEKAVKNFDLAMQKAPTAAEPISAKVKSLLALDKQAEAIDWLETVVDNQPDNVIAINLLGEVKLTQKFLDEAIVAFEKALEVNPKWPVPHRNIALAYLAEDKSEQAIAALNKGIDQVDQSIALRTELAQLLERNGDVDGAIEQYEIMTEDKPVPLFAANNLAMLLVSYRSDDQESLDRAIGVAEVLRGSDNPLFLDTLGWVYYKRDQIDLAFPLVREAARKAPEVHQINYHLGKIYAAKEDAGSAIPYLEKALEGSSPFAGKEDAEKLLSQLKASINQG